MKIVMRFISGAVFGGVLGSVAVLLLAPGSGSETRAAFLQKFAMMQEQIRRAVQEKRQQLETELNTLKKT